MADDDLPENSSLPADDAEILSECWIELDTRLEYTIQEFTKYYGSKATTPGVVSYTILLLLSKTVGRMLATSHPDNLAECERFVHLYIEQGKELESKAIEARQQAKVLPVQDQADDPYGLASMPVEGNA